VHDRTWLKTVKTLLLGEQKDGGVAILNALKVKA
jgi:hypothetical protein